MATQNEHGRLIVAAAKAALAPIGCTRRGQSRVWISDQGYWAIMIEFQPSGFSRGSYLNVGASWLWYDKSNGGLNFNVGYRVKGADFISFENAAQFRPLVEKMAAQAGDEVLALRARFPSIGAISRFLNAEPNGQLVWMFSAAVAAGLNGEFALSRDRFEMLLSDPPGDDSYAPKVEWRAKLHSQALTLAAVLDDPPQFRAAVRYTVDKRRREVHLPQLADCLKGMNSTVAPQRRSRP